MRPYILRGLVALLGVGFVAIGVAALLVPGFAAALYGVDATTSSARVFVRAAGARDVAIAAILFGLLTRRSDPRSLSIAVFGATLVPIFDSVSVLQASGVQLALILHAGSILPMMVLAIALVGVRDNN
ncbi:MAG TPA: DUF4267 domain-containing protein [Pyrinomonadaceae bacterium]|nr:DUF4267 domain-containing protein [Pyrinomonadaceae bacterium]